MGEEVTVAELFRDPGHWNGARFADPLDRDHDEVPRTAFADPTAAPPYLYSDAQGGVRYELMREVREIVIEKGEKPRATDEILEVIDAAGDLYMHGGELVCVYDYVIVPVNDVALADYLERRIRFYEIKIGKVRTDLTGSLCRRVLAKARSSGQRTMKGIITAPTLRPDGRLFASPAMTAQLSFCFAAKVSSWCRTIRLCNSCARPLQTLATLSQFPFVSAHDRGVMRRPC